MPDMKKKPLPEEDRRELTSRVGATRPTPAPTPGAAPLDLQSELSNRRSRLQSLTSRATLDGILAEAEKLTNRLQAIPTQIDDLNKRGYRYGKAWPARYTALKQTWDTQRSVVLTRINDQRQLLRRFGDQVTQLLGRATSASALPAVDNDLNTFENMILQAETAIRDLTQNLERDLSALERELKDAAFVLEAFAAASFPALPDEAPIAAVEARWLTQKDEGPRGLLFLTNARLAFEQREKVATKKVLFVTTASEEVKKLLWQFPIGALREVTTQDKSAFLSHQEWLILRAEYRDIPPTITLKLEGGARNEDWAQRIEMVRLGQIEAYVSESAAPSAADDIAYENAPTECPRCKGQLPPVYKGMTQVTCEYCGTVVPLPRRS